MGLSAWKAFGQARWALRVNPSSGNLHPTEAYVVWGGRVCHYAPREHALEVRCALEAPPMPETSFLVGLSSVVWREGWKYGERAFRYCQHDVGHALGALRFAAALLGWRLRLLPRWSDAELAMLFGLDRESDFDGAEREEPECIAVVAADERSLDTGVAPAAWLEAARRGRWAGVANRLSHDHVEWPIIDEVARATAAPGTADTRLPRSPATSAPPAPAAAPARTAPSARTLILQRRSAVAFDGRSSLPRARFLQMLSRLNPPAPPWDALDWDSEVHLVLFVHRVDGLVPGLYTWVRREAAVGEWKAALRGDLLWEPVPDATPLWLLAPFDCRALARRLSCDQDIAADGFFSLGMVARVEATLQQRGEWFYRRLFWECGFIGQVLYLEAEAAGTRATGIGCFYDDPVHDVLGLTGHAWQSLYHLAMGAPVDDPRLTTEPGYAWEGAHSH